MRCRALLLLGLLGWLGCSTTTGPISGRHYQDRTLKPTDIRYVAIREPGCFEYGKYLLVQQFPNYATIMSGMPSRQAFERLGKATAVSIEMWSIPPAEVARQEGRNVVMEWRTRAFWVLARRRPDEKIETLEIAVQFVKLTRSRTEIQELGTPVLRDNDAGWIIEKVEFLPGIYNPKSPSARRR